MRDEGKRRTCGIQISFELLGGCCCFLCSVGIRSGSFGGLPNHAWIWLQFPQAPSHPWRSSNPQVFFLSFFLFITIHVYLFCCMELFQLFQDFWKRWAKALSYFLNKFHSFVFCWLQFFFFLGGVFDSKGRADCFIKAKSRPMPFKVKCGFPFYLPISIGLI